MTLTEINFNWVLPWAKLATHSWLNFVCLIHPHTSSQRFQLCINFGDVSAAVGKCLQGNCREIIKYETFLLRKKNKCKFAFNQINCFKNANLFFLVARDNSILLRKNGGGRSTFQNLPQHHAFSLDLAMSLHVPRREAFYVVTSREPFVFLASDFRLRSLASLYFKSQEKPHFAILICSCASSVDVA